jgi:uncharacterized RmlC-like cupin family protein
MNIQKIEFIPKYKRENGLYVIDLDKCDIPFKVMEKSVVYIPKGQFGGNHKHSRTEALVSLGDNLKLLWMDKDNEVHEEMMYEDGKLSLFVIPSGLAHAVLNVSKNSFGVLIEFTNESQGNVEVVDLVSRVFAKEP